MQKSFIKAKETFEDRCNLIHNFKYKYFNDYTGRHNKIKVLCIKCGNLFCPIAGNHLNGSGCPQCCKIHEHVYKIEFIKNNYNVVKIPENLNCKSKIEIQCKRCNAILLPRIDSLKNLKCMCMRSKYGKEIKELLYEKYKDRYLYDIDDTKLVKCRDKLKIKCIKCNKEFKQSFSAHYNVGQGCPYCNKSKAESKIIEILDKMKIPFEQNKSFSDCFNPETHRRLYFDFYFLQHNLCIEYDGEQHFRGWRKSSVNRTKEYYQKLDSIKNKYCIDKDIKLIRIHYKDFKNIETILKNIFFVGDK